MTELTRREFGKILLSAGGSLFLPDRLLDALPEKEALSLKWKEIGPSLKNNDGVRSLIINPRDPEQILASTYDKGTQISNDGGSTWNTLAVPHPADISSNTNTARDMVPLRDNCVLLLADYSISVYKFGDEQVKIDASISENKMSGGPQTGCVVGSDLIIAGFGGAYKTSLSRLMNHTNGIFDWGKPIPFENLSFHMIRSIAYDQKNRLIYAGGCLSPKDEETGRLWSGTGLYISKDGGKSFSEHSLHDQMKDPNGLMSINTITCLNYKGHDLVLIGGEGNGSGQRYSGEELPFFRILIDGKLYDRVLCNNQGLSEACGYGLVTPQRGIVADPQLGIAFISMFGAEIAGFNLDDIIEGRKIDYQVVTKPKFGETYFGAGHLCLTRTSPNRSQIATGGAIFTSNSPVQVRVAEITTPNDSMHQTV